MDVRRSDTAVVIKNIPFHLPRQDLFDFMMSVNIPRPLAFNYHLDKDGQFRGMAFANFSDPAHAAVCVAIMNGAMVLDRMLRAEYKILLPDDDERQRERIARSKQRYIDIQINQVEKMKKAGHIIPTTASTTGSLTSSQATSPNASGDTIRFHQKGAFKSVESLKSKELLLRQPRGPVDGDAGFHYIRRIVE